MRIISRQNDYYDATMAHGQDQSLVFLRERLAFSGQQIKSLLKPLEVLHTFMVQQAPPAIESSQQSKNFARLHVGFGMVLLAGTLHPFTYIRRAKLPVAMKLDFSVDATELFSYDKDELKGILQEHGLNFKSKPKQSFNMFGKQSTANMEDFFKLAGDTRMSGHCTEHNLPLVSTSPQKGFELNTRLADLQFFRHMTGPQVHQELSMFLGNIAAPDRTPLVVAEKYRIIQHGFDKQSFRKRPSLLD